MNIIARPAGILYDSPPLVHFASKPIIHYYAWCPTKQGWIATRP